MTHKSLSLSIGKKIFLGFFILIFIYLGIGIQRFSEMNEINSFADQAVSLSYEITSLQEFAISLETLEKDIDKFFLTNYKENQEEVDTDLDKMKSILRSIEINADSNLTARIQDIERIRSEIRTNFYYLANSEQFGTNSKEINEKTILVYGLLNSEKQKHHELLLETTNKIQVNVKDQKLVVARVIKEYIFLGILILVFGIFLSFITSLSISRPIDKLRVAAVEIGHGRFNINIPVQSNDEVGQLAAAFNKMAQELQKTTVSKDYVDNIFRSMFDMLFVATPNGIIQKVNKAICDLLGYSTEELLGQSIDKLIFDNISPSESSNFYELVKKGSIINIEKYYLAKDGRKIPVLLSMSNMCDDEGNNFGVVCVARDITERKRAEDLLIRSKEFAETVLNSMKDSISIIDVNNFRIIDVNSVFLNNYGMKKEEVIGKSCYAITHKRLEPCIPPDDICPLIDTLNSGGHSTAEHVHYMKDGEKRYVEVSTSPIKDENGRIIKVIHVARDITERKVSEVKIKASLEEKEVLLREIHHRVKNNMQIVSSLLMLQSETIEDKKYRDIFIDSQNRIQAMALIHQKLYQSQSLAQINFKEYIDSIVSNLFESYGQKNNIKLDIDVENIPIKIDYAVPCGLIINELVTNSFKYAFPDGRQGIIKISVKSNDNNMIQLSIKDNGIGISKDMEIRNTKSLGLKLVTGLAESQLHGQIILNRENGAEFQINFRQAK
jgi:PAS domain S-box-containing protein